MSALLYRATLMVVTMSLSVSNESIAGSPESPTRRQPATLKEFVIAQPIPHLGFRQASWSEEATSTPTAVAAHASKVGVSLWQLAGNDRGPFLEAEGTIRPASLWVGADDAPLLIDILLERHAPVRVTEKSLLQSASGTAPSLLIMSDESW